MKDELLKAIMSTIETQMRTATGGPYEFSRLEWKAGIQRRVELDAKAAERMRRRIAANILQGLVVEQVYIVEGVGGRAVYASEEAVRDAITTHWRGVENVALADVNLRLLEAWDGQSPLAIASHRVTRETVML